MPSVPKRVRSNLYFPDNPVRSSMGAPGPENQQYKRCHGSLVEMQHRIVMREDRYHSAVQGDLQPYRE
jgi:hypothetical protein